MRQEQENGSNLYSKFTHGSEGCSDVFGTSSKNGRKRRLKALAFRLCFNYLSFASTEHTHETKFLFGRRFGSYALRNHARSISDGSRSAVCQPGCAGETTGRRHRHYNHVPPPGR